MQTDARSRSQDIFERHAEAYDAWYDSRRGASLFRAEVACLRSLLNIEPPRPWLEVGIGTGRFAVALGIDHGIDSAAAVLRLAETRGARVKRGQAESLPYEDGSFGAVFLIVTLCFVEDPQSAVREAARVLRDGGSLVAGFVPRDSAWGQHYLRQAAEGHRFYSAASFFTVADVRRFASEAGLAETAAAGVLTEAPGLETENYAPPLCDITEDTGFVALRFTKCRGIADTGADSAETDTLTGETIEQRGRMVLATLGETPEDIRRAYRRLAKQHHPDRAPGSAEGFQLVLEAYDLLSRGRVPRRPLLADDALLTLVLSRRVAPLLNRQKEWGEYETWRKEHFYDAGVF